MPRVIRVQKARIAPGQCGKCSCEIAVGESYVWWKFRFGGKHVRCAQPKCYPKPSELTQSDFMSQFLRIEEAVEDAVNRVTDDLDDLVSQLNDAASELESLAGETMGKKDNMPENLQDGETGQQLEQRGERCEAIASELSDLASDLETRWGDRAEDKGEDQTEEEYAQELAQEVSNIDWSVD